MIEGEILEQGKHKLIVGFRSLDNTSPDEFKCEDRSYFKARMLKKWHNGTLYDEVREYIYYDSTEIVYQILMDRMTFMASKESDYIDVSDEHIEQDNILCGLLRKLGYHEMVDVYESIPKYYE